jgi:hypothetical protein
MTRTAFISTAPPARLGEHVPFDERRVYIGFARETIRGRLRHHLRAGGACTRSATEFDYESSADPLSRYRR